MNPRSNRFVFIAGLHRTGTSLLSRILAAHPHVSAIEGSPVPENEGCYLQGAIAHTALHGQPGQFATDPDQHHTELSAYNTLETRMRLLADWEPWFAQDKPWWIEKSPVNLTRMRLYQQLFPTSQFIVILRHPQIMAAALAKWVDTDPQDLVRYALDAYDIMAADLPYLHSALVLRYEDLVANADAVRRGVFGFLSLPDQAADIEIIDGNGRYSVPTGIDAHLSRRMTRWGYMPGGTCNAFQPVCQHPLRSVRDTVKNALPAIDSRNIDPGPQKEQKANIRQ
ncbi:sulfotransferase family protein [Aurantiacibacter rhizosphaerae]|uniref:Sulfotransferase n=1 Tax=Aurantiacibacter rhizosphaerae TaxID=2691582 RepID=A0A844XBM4_9SPHN|nr:sulfotransferase [Aurantiacibacter rhizosphaerae]MWV27112.1 sulfotransferase [Aurantiacibacter rhizosphaerae]